MNSIHKFKYDYSKVNYVNQNTNIDIICKIHGLFSQLPLNHQKGRGCPKCGKLSWIEQKKSNTQEFIEKSVKIHGNIYNYDKVKYVSSREKVIINCPKHGDFSIKPNNHLSGKGCRYCSFDFCTFKRKDWIEKGKGKIGKFYILRCWNENEQFIKFGITYQSVEKRYNYKPKLPYNWEIVKIVESEDLGYIWDLEKRFKSRKKKQRYSPLIEFPGSVTECFK